MGMPRVGSSDFLGFVGALPGVPAPWLREVSAQSEHVGPPLRHSPAPGRRLR